MNEALIEAMALAAINRKLVAGGWPTTENPDSVPDSESYVDGVKAALAAAREAGFVMVPVEPTEEMIGEGWSMMPLEWGTPLQEACTDGIEAMWSAMLAAAQQSDGGA